MDDDEEERDTDDEMIQSSSIYMLRTWASVDPSDEVFDVKAQIKYSNHPALDDDKVYAIADGGADCCCSGKLAKVTCYIDNMQT